MGLLLQGQPHTGPNSWTTMLVYFGLYIAFAALGPQGSSKTCRMDSQSSPSSGLLLNLAVSVYWAGPPGLSSSVFGIMRALLFGVHVRPLNLGSMLGP